MSSGESYVVYSSVLKHSVKKKIHFVCGVGARLDSVKMTGTISPAPCDINPPARGVAGRGGAWRGVAAAPPGIGGRPHRAVLDFIQLASGP